MKKLFLLLAVVMMTALSAAAQNRTVSGTVVDAATDEPLVGATVQPVGGGNGVATDINGHFTLSIPAQVSRITVSYIGYESRTVAVQDKMTIGLTSVASDLDEVVVTGYGSGKKLGSLVGSVSVVNDKVLENTPSSNFVDALQGQVPGLAIYSNSGEPASVPSSIRIRGLNSIDASTTPLFILDGAPTTSTVFTTLSPNDIESVTVLKDAASTAIYGSRAANGVIVITTKKGKYGDKATVTVRANIGWSARVDQNVEMMNSKQYVEFRDKIGMPVDESARHAALDLGIDTDWEKEMIKDSAPTYSVEGVVQGGGENNRYYLSLGHYDQEGLISNSQIRRETLTAKMDIKAKSWLKVGFNANLGYEAYGTNAAATGWYYQNPFVGAYQALPYDSPYYYTEENGKLIYGEKAKYLRYSDMIEPNYYSQITLNGRRSSLNANMNLYEEITPIKGLTLRAQQAVTAYDYRLTNVVNPQESFFTPMGDFVDMSSIASRDQELFQRYYQFTYTNTAEYKFNIDRIHNFAVLLGQESIITRSNQFGITTYGQPSATQWLLTQGTTVAISNATQSIYRYLLNSWFLNFTYDYDSRYFLDFNIRRDGSSKFAPGHRWSTFFSIGGMWDAKAEKFLQPYKWLDALKVRVNYGTAGNSGIDPYQYDGTVGSGNIYNGQSSLGISTQSNSDLTWETVRSFDAGLDIGLFDRVRLSADFYVKNTHDMLMDIPYSITTGFSSGTANIASMRNTGVDFEVGVDVFKNRDWYVGVRANFNYNRNIITELFNGLDEYKLPEYGLVYRVGENPMQLNTVRYAGVDPRDGQQMWYDKDGNLTKTYNSERDAVNTGKSFYAPWNGGFGIDASWKGLSLRADFTWAAEKYIFNWTNQVIMSAEQGLGANQRVEMLGVWTKPGDVTDIPGLVDLYGNAQTVQADSRYLEDSSFVRMKNLTIAYTLPKKWLNAIDLSNVTFHFTGRNLLTFTGFTGTDPEYENNGVRFFYPNTRQYEFGFDVTF